MTEADWLASVDPGKMLHFVTENPDHANITCCRSPRKLELLRQVWASSFCGAERYLMGYILPLGRIDNLCQEVCLNITSKYKPRAANILREIVGNPFRHLSRSERVSCRRCYGTGQSGGGNYNPTCTGCSGLGWIERPHSWLTPLVLSLATAAYDERSGRRCEACGGTGDVHINRIHRRGCKTCHGTGRSNDGTLGPDRLAILSDALEEAGCTDKFLLWHLRGWEPCPESLHDEVAPYPGIGNSWMRSRSPHVRGCHALDLILGQE